MEKFSPMPRLSDKEIRAVLLRHLNNRALKPAALIEELGVFNGNAIADIVAIYKAAHCYEIKGETDSLNRILVQGPIYDQAFKKTTLVTTENHYKNALRYAPAHWGLIIVRCNKAGEPRVCTVRKSVASPTFNKQIALLTLWKSELAILAEQSKNKTQRSSRQLLTLEIAAKNSTSAVEYAIGRMLSLRKDKIC